MIKTSNEVVPHFFELGVGAGMFEEEVSLAELELKEGTHFGVVSEGQEVLQQVEIVMLEVDAGGWLVLEGVGLAKKTLLGIIRLTPFVDMCDNVLQVGNTVTCGGQCIITEVRCLYFGIVRQDTATGFSIETAWIGLMLVDERTIGCVIGKVGVACLNSIDVVGPEDGGEDIGHTIAWLGHIVEAGIVHDAGCGTEGFTEGGVAQVFGAISMRGAEVMFEAKAMSYLVGCGITDEVEHKCVGNLVAHHGIVGSCLQEEPRLEFCDDIGVEEHIGL